MSLSVGELAKRITLYGGSVIVSSTIIMGVAALLTPIVARPIIADTVKAAVEAERQRASTREDAMLEQIVYMRQDIRSLTEEMAAGRRQQARRGW